MTTIEALIERVKAATGPDRGLDEALRAHFGYPPKPWNYTASIDAITALIERVLPGWHIASGTVGDEPDQPWACLTSPDNPHPDFPAFHVTEALARTEALLIALQSQGAA